MKALNLIIKILILVALVGIGVLIYTTCSGSPLVQRIDKTQPDITVAPFEVSTATHIYYARQVTVGKDNSVTMLGWYERLNKKWVLQNESITLPSYLHPNVGKRMGE